MLYEVITINSSQADKSKEAIEAAISGASSKLETEVALTMMSTGIRCPTKEDSTLASPPKLFTICCNFSSSRPATKIVFVRSQFRIKTTALAAPPVPKTMARNNFV